MLTVPEVATLLFGNGAGCADALVVQQEIFHLQQSLEEAFHNVAVKAAACASSPSAELNNATTSKGTHHLDQSGVKTETVSHNNSDLGTDSHTTPVGDHSTSAREDSEQSLNHHTSRNSNHHSRHHNSAHSRHEISGVTGRVLLCDRGIMDGSAYVKLDWFEQMLLSKGMTIADVREKRYEAVSDILCLIIEKRTEIWCKKGNLEKNKMLPTCS